jgi:hypothetical protein
MFIVVGMLSDWRGPSSAAQPVEAKSGSASIARLDDGSLSYQAASGAVTLRNPGVESLYVDALEFHRRRFTVDERPNLVFQLAPFFDVLTVRVTNVGWGPYEGKDFSLFGEDAKTEDGLRRLAELFDVRQPTVPLTRVERDAVLVFPLGPNAVPFDFFAGGKFRTASMQAPPPLPGVERHVAFPTATSRWVAALRTIPDAVYSGAESFAGRLVSSESPNRKVDYLARTYQPVAFDNEEQFLSDRCDSPFSGALFEDWRFVFGGAALKSVAAVRVVERFGITVDLADGQAAKIVVPLQLQIPPQGATTFNIEFLTAKSADFQVGGSCQYRIGRGPRNTVPLSVSWEGHTRVPRPLELGYENTKGLVQKVLERDADLVRRARSWIKGLLDTESSVRLVSLTQRGQSQSWKLRDGLVVLLNSADADDGRLAAEVLVRFAQQVSAETKPSQELRSAARDVFPLLCRYQPARAVALAVHTATAGYVSDELIQCALMQRTRPYLASYTDELRKSLGDAGEAQWWTNRQVALAACLNVASELGRVLSTKISGPDFESQDLGVLVWAASQIKRAEVDQSLRERFRSSKVSGDVIRQVVDSLVTCRNDRLRSDVIAYATSVKGSSAHAEVLLACLRYLDRFPGADARPLLLELGEYPYRSEIRDKAKKILGQS